MSEALQTELVHNTPTEDRLEPSKAIKIMVFLAVGFFTFLVFLYFSLPYAVIKEAICSKVSSSTSIVLRIDDLEPALPFGLIAKNISIDPTSSTKGIHLKQARVTLSLGSLLLGRLGAHIKLDSDPKGQLQVFVGKGLWSLFQGDLLPSAVELESNAFSLGGLVDGLIELAGAALQSNQVAAAMVGPLLQQVSFKGFLNGDADLEFDIKGGDSEGHVNLSVKDGLLRIDDPSLDIDEQKFGQFKIAGQLNKNKLVFDKSTVIESQGLLVTVGGYIDLMDPISRSKLNVNLSVKLKGRLRDSFKGFLSILNFNNQGELKQQITGTLSRPRFVAL